MFLWMQNKHVDKGKNVVSYIELHWCTEIQIQASFMLLPAYLFFVVPTGLQPTEPSHS